MIIEIAIHADEFMALICLLGVVAIFIATYRYQTRELKGAS